MSETGRFLCIFMRCFSEASMKAGRNSTTEKSVPFSSYPAGLSFIPHVFDMVGMDAIVSTNNNTTLQQPMKTLLTNKNVLVTDTDEYILIKIPKPHKALTKKQPTWESLVGVLKDVPEFQGKTSVEVQDMIIAQ